MIWFTALFVLAKGAVVGDREQFKYLVKGIALADPSFVPGDWFTWSTVDSHMAYSTLIAGLTRAGLLEPGLLLGSILQHVVFAFAVYLLVSALYDRPLLPWAATLMLFGSLGNAGLGSANLIDPIFLASTISGVAVVLGIALAARTHFFGAGCAFGFAALFHAQYALLLFPVVATINLSQNRKDWQRAGIALWSPYFLLGAPTFVSIAALATRAGTEPVFEIALMRMPWHIAPSTWSRAPFAVFVAFLLLGIGGALIRTPRPNRTLRATAAVVLVVVVTSIAIGFTERVQAVNLSWPWRLSSLLVLFAAATFTAAVVGPEPLEGRSAGARAIGMTALLLGVGILLRFVPLAVAIAAFAASMFPAAVAICDRVQRRWGRAQMPALTALGALLTLGFVPSVLAGIGQSKWAIGPDDPHRAALYTWIRERTDESSIFAVPPHWEDFRVNARRPIVADWRSIPWNPPDRLEWMDRMRELSGSQSPDGEEALRAGYATIDCSRAARLRRLYNVRYVVVDRAHALGCGTVVFQDPQHSVVDLAS